MNIRAEKLPLSPGPAGSDLALLSYDQKRYEKAEEYFQHILAIYEKWLGPEHPGTQEVLSNFISLVQIAERDIEIFRFPLEINENTSDEIF